MCRVIAKLKSCVFCVPILESFYAGLPIYLRLVLMHDAAELEVVGQVFRQPVGEIKARVGRGGDM